MPTPVSYGKSPGWMKLRRRTSAGSTPVASATKSQTRSMTKVASEALAKQVTSEERAAGLLFPAVSRLRSVSFEIAVAVAHQAIQDGVAEVGGVRTFAWDLQAAD